MAQSREQEQRTQHPLNPNQQAAGDEKDPKKAAEEEQRMRDEAEARTAGMPQPGSAPIGKVTGAMFAKANDETTVKMNFPSAVSLTLDDYRMISFDEGIQEVPVSVKDHPYLKANGATPV